jgi:hypothetical protein
MTFATIANQMQGQERVEVELRYARELTVVMVKNQESSLVGISREIGTFAERDPFCLVKKGSDLHHSRRSLSYMVDAYCRISAVGPVKKHPTGGYGGTELIVKESRGSTGP